MYVLILILFILEKDYYQCHILGFCPIFCSFVDFDHIGLPGDQLGFLVDFKTESFGTNRISLGIIMGNNISICLRFKTCPNCEYSLVFKIRTKRGPPVF